MKRTRSARKSSLKPSNDPISELEFAGLLFSKCKAFPDDYAADLKREDYVPPEDVMAEVEKIKTKRNAEAKKKSRRTGGIKKEVRKEVKRENDSNEEKKKETTKVQNMEVKKDDKKNMDLDAAMKFVLSSGIKGVIYTGDLETQWRIDDENEEIEKWEKSKMASSRRGPKTPRLGH